MTVALASWQAFYWPIAIGCLLLVAEVLTGTLVLLGLGIGMIGVAVAQFCSGTSVPVRDAAIFILVSACCLLLVRLVFRRRHDTATARDDINTY